MSRDRLIRESVQKNLVLLNRKQIDDHKAVELLKLAIQESFLPDFLTKLIYNRRNLSHQIADICRSSNSLPYQLEIELKLMESRQTDEADSPWGHYAFDLHTASQLFSAERTFTVLEKVLNSHDDSLSSKALESLKKIYLKYPSLRAPVLDPIILQLLSSPHPQTQEKVASEFHTLNIEGKLLEKVQETLKALGKLDASENGCVSK